MAWKKGIRPLRAVFFTASNKSPRSLKFPSTTSQTRVNGVRVSNTVSLLFCVWETTSNSSPTEGEEANIKCEHTIKFKLITLIWRSDGIKMANPTLVSFGRACASLRAPVFLSSLIHKTGRCAPPAHRSFAASYSSPKTKSKLFYLRDFDRYWSYCHLAKLRQLL